jgi:precorrin-6B methylase 1
MKTSVLGPASVTPKEIVRFLASCLRPTTLAAVCNDLLYAEENANVTDDDFRLADKIVLDLRHQLECLVGDDEAQRMLDAA